MVFSVKGFFLCTLAYVTCTSYDITQHNTSTSPFRQTLVFEFASSFCGVRFAASFISEADQAMLSRCELRMESLLSQIRYVCVCACACVMSRVFILCLFFPPSLQSVIDNSWDDCEHMPFYSAQDNMYYRRYLIKVIIIRIRK